MITVNLIPKRVQDAQVRRRHIKGWTLINLVAGVSLAVPVCIDRVQQAKAQELQLERTLLTRELTAMRKQLAVVEGQAEDAFLRLQRADALRSKRAWSGMLALIGSAMPPQCWLTRLATDPKTPGRGPSRPAPAVKRPPAGQASPQVMIEAPRKLRLIGRATGASDPLAFVTNLKETGVFHRVSLAGTSREQGERESNFRFEIVCEW